MTDDEGEWRLEAGRMRQRLQRERRARRQAETIAEQSLRRLDAQHGRFIELLDAITIKANDALTVDEVLRLATRLVCQFAGWRLGHAYVVSGEKNARRMVSTRIWHVEDADRFREFIELTEATDFAPDVGLLGRVLTSGKPASVVGIVEDDHFIRAACAIRCGLRSAYAFPLLAGGAVVAALEFFSAETLEIEPIVRQLVTQIGVHLGRVIERRRVEERLRFDATHDSLTNLSNRSLFVERLERAIEARRTNADGAGFSLLFIDLDHFKLVNDSLGHEAGDLLLVEVASRLQRSLRRDDTILCLAERDRQRGDGGACMLARLGGDEFAVLLKGVEKEGDAQRVAGRLQRRLKRPFMIKGFEVCTTASIGIVTSRMPHVSSGDLLRDADIAMYRAKQSGKARSVIFDEAMRLVAMDRLRLEADLRHAIARGELVVHYQPIVRLDDATISGFEALVRWRHPERGLIPPNDFIPLAEESGLIGALGLWVLREACLTLGRWQALFVRRPRLTMSVNMSTRQFTHPEIVSQVRRVIEQTRVDPSTLRLEITESTAMSDTEQATRVLNKFKSLGVRISVDDFGTGFSSLSYLYRLPADVLKIDRSFVSAMDTSAESRRIVETILVLARSLGLKVVAEGTETAAQVAQLRNMGCEFGQGYFFSRPRDEAGIEAMLRVAFGSVDPRDDACRRGAALAVASA